MRRMSNIGCHLYSTVTKTVLRLLVITISVLGIVYQHISSLGEGEKFRVALLTPFHIGGINNTVTGIFDTVERRAIQWVTLSHLRKDTHGGLCDRRLPVLKLWFATALAPDNLFVTANSMKRALRRQRMYIYREIRRRHDAGYNLLDTLTRQLWAETVNICLWFKQGDKKWETDKMIAMTVCNEQ